MIYFKGCKWCPEPESNQRHADFQSNHFSAENKPVADEKYQDKAGTTGERDTLAHLPKSDLSRFMQDRHLRAARAVGCALTLADAKTWAAMAVVWEARLEHPERYELARSLMLAMRPEDTEALFTDVMGGAGYPLPPFLDPLDDAQWWADLANPAERRAYCLATFMAMSKREQRDFLEFAKEVPA